MLQPDQESNQLNSQNTESHLSVSSQLDLLREVKLNIFSLFDLPFNNLQLYDFTEIPFVFDNTNMIVNFSTLPTQNAHCTQSSLIKVNEIFNFEEYTILYATNDIDYYEQFNQWQSMAYYIVHRDNQIF